MLKEHLTHSVNGMPVGFRGMLLAVLIAISSTTVWAGDLLAPQGKVLLTVTGNIDNVNIGQAAKLDRHHLESLPQHALKTSNPFVQGLHLFEGVLLADVLDLVGASGDQLTARGVDGYSADIPVLDARKYNVLVATKMDGKVMRIRSKGPLWIIYPVDQFDELRAEHFSSRSVWQLISLTVK